VLRAAFLELQFGLIVFWRKNIGTKAASNILMKLTTAQRNANKNLLRDMTTAMQLNQGFSTYAYSAYSLSRNKINNLDNEI